jgi:2-dehydropantoate 2-reductase
MDKKMFDKNSKIVVIGAGGVGGITATLMAKAGYNVEVVCKYPGLAETIKTKGLHIFGLCEDHHVIVPAVAAVHELKEKKDFVLIATKAYDMPPAARQVLPYLKDNSAVVSMQNGICEDILAEIVGQERTIGCIVGWGATMHQPGELEMTSTGEFVIGNLNNQIDERIKFLKTVLETIYPVEISQNIMGHLYSKLIINSCITTLGAICGLYLGEMLAVKKIRGIFLEIMEEAIAVANAHGIKVETYAGKLDYYRFLKSKSFLGNLKRHLFIRIIGYKYRRLKSSSLQSLERGKKTEIDYLNGYIAKLAKQKNVPVPVNDVLLKMVKEIEAGKRKISMDNFQSEEI